MVKMKKVFACLVAFIMASQFVSIQSYAATKKPMILTDKNMDALYADPMKYKGDKVNIEVSIFLPVSEKGHPNAYASMLAPEIQNDNIVWGVIENLHSGYTNTGDKLHVYGVVLGTIKVNNLNGKGYNVYPDIRCTTYTKE